MKPGIDTAWLHTRWLPSLERRFHGTFWRQLFLAFSPRHEKHGVWPFCVHGTMAWKKKPQLPQKGSLVRFEVDG